MIHASVKFSTKYADIQLLKRPRSFTRALKYVFSYDIINCVTDVLLGLLPSRVCLDGIRNASKQSNYSGCANYFETRRRNKYFLSWIQRRTLPVVKLIRFSSDVNIIYHNQPTIFTVLQARGIAILFVNCHFSIPEC